jgi:F0F1-type ATP synthase assembly protein I
LKQARKAVNNYAKYSGMGFQMLAIIGIGVFGGVKLDEIIDLDFPVFTIVFSIISVFLAIYVIIKDLLKNG